MTWLKSTYAMLIFLPLVAVSGCAEFSKCGPDGCADDQTITANIQAQLDQQRSLGAPGSITVRTRNHVVILEGFVDAGLEKHIAESIAKKARSVTEVVNNIAVDHD
jgi:osmotically-inducible protein OsmY